MKKLLVLFLVFVIIFSCVACNSANENINPANYPDTVWQTEDGNFKIEICDGHAFHRGYVVVGEETEEMYFKIQKDDPVILGYTKAEFNSTKPEIFSENWTITASEDGKIKVTVNLSNFFVKDQQLIFVNKGENTANDNFITLAAATEIAKKECEKHFTATSFDFWRIENHKGNDCYAFLADDLKENDENRDSYQIIAIYVNAKDGKVVDVWQHN